MKRDKLTSPFQPRELPRPEVSRIKKPNNKYYKRKLKQIRKGLV